MKSKKKIVKRLVSLLLCGSICVVAAAAVSDGEMKTLELESVDYYMAVRANGGVDLTSEEKQIHTNAAGDTYGEAMVVKYLDADVDLISAIGKNGTEGYIKTSDLPYNIPDYIPHDHEIPVYASDGVTIIDSFFISSGYTNTVDAP